MVCALALLTGQVFLSPALAATAQIKAVRYWQSPESTRVVFDLSAPVKYTLSQQGNNIVLELPRSGTALKVDEVPITSDLITKVSTDTEGDTLRITLALKQAARPKHFTLKPFKQYGNRLVVDLYEAVGSEAVRTEAPVSIAKPGTRDIVIAIDAGHGGDDPGAIGPGGTYEKTITLAIAKRMADAFNARKGMKAVLIRTGDYFIPLARRPEIARQKKADLFVSVHADGFHDKRARGASIWTLSNRRAKGEMGRWLENSENASDLIGGVESVSLGDKDKVLAEVLLDLSMTHSMTASYDVGKAVLKQIGSFAHLHKRDVQQASLKVLTSPDIPSILVETAFISNPNEEKLLSARAHQDKLIDAVVNGVHGYMKRRPPPGAEYALSGTPEQGPSIAQTSYAPDAIAATDAPPVIKRPSPRQSAAVNSVSAAAPSNPAAQKMAHTVAENKPVKPVKPPRPLYLNTIASSLEYAKRRAAKEQRAPATPKVVPPSTRHKVQIGDSLSRIASLYKVSMNELRSYNELKSDQVNVGQVLAIPNS